MKFENAVCRHLSRFQRVNNGMLSTGRTWEKKSDHIIPLWISDYKEPEITIRVVVNHQKQWSHIMDHDSAWKTAREWYKKKHSLCSEAEKVIDISQTTFFTCTCIVLAIMFKICLRFHDCNSRKMTNVTEQCGLKINLVTIGHGRVGWLRSMGHYSTSSIKSGSSQ